MAGKAASASFGLLHAQHVGTGVLDPFLDALPTGRASEFTFQVAMRIAVKRP